MLKEKTVEFVKEVKEVKEEALMFIVKTAGAEGIMDMLEDESGAGKFLVKGFKLMDMALDLLSEESKAIDVLLDNNDELNRKVNYLVDLNRDLNRKLDRLINRKLDRLNDKPVNENDELNHSGRYPFKED